MDILTLNEVKKLRKELKEASKKYKKVQELITDSRTWEVPAGIKNNQVQISIIGGGGSGFYVLGHLLDLPIELRSINITIGTGGERQSEAGKVRGFAGSLSSFSSFITVEGGQPGTNSSNADGNGTNRGGWEDYKRHSAGGKGGNRGGTGGSGAGTSSGAYYGQGYGADGLRLGLDYPKPFAGGVGYGAGGDGDYDDTNRENISNMGQAGCCLIEYEIEVGE